MYLKSQRKVGFELKFCLPLSDLGNFASQKVKHWNIEVIHYTLSFVENSRVKCICFPLLTSRSALNCQSSRSICTMLSGPGWDCWDVWIGPGVELSGPCGSLPIRVFCDSVKMRNAFHAPHCCRALLVPNQSCPIPS